MKASDASSEAYKNVTDPTLLVSPPILPCEDKFFAKLPCYDFVWSGNHSRRVTDIVSAIMANNPGRPIPINKVYTVYELLYFPLLRLYIQVNVLDLMYRFNRLRSLMR